MTVNSIQEQAFFQFNVYLDLEASEQTGFLDELRTRDLDLHDEVCRLIHVASDSQSGFATQIKRQLEEHFSEPQPGEWIGRYQILKPLGSGGMGRVYLAKQEQPSRQVALKLIKPGLDSQHTLQRFHQEFQVLAHLEHPGIATLFEAGTRSTGHPFFAMEYIQGVPLTDYCNNHQLNLEARLELFISVCRAVAHAHQNGIIHRDLKPSNILISQVDGRPTAKVIDFGIARMLSTPEPLPHETGPVSSQKDALSRTGAVIGTPMYMSPEQAKGQHCDTRADVYALGVILHELLIGRPPMDQKTPKQQNTNPERLKRLNATLGWILKKCLQTDKDSRYDTVNLLVQDLSLFLKQQPVSVGPKGWAYPFGMFLRRNKYLLAGMTLALTLVIAGLVGTITGALKANREAAHARSTVSLLQEFLSSVDPSKEGRDLKVRQLLDAFEPRINQDFEGKEETRAALHQTYSNTYASLGLYAKAEPHALAAIQLLKSLEEPGHLMAAQLTHLKILQELDRFDKAIPIAKDLLQHYRQDPTIDPVKILDFVVVLGDLELNQGKLAEAEERFKYVYEERQRTQGIDHPDTLASMNSLAAVWTRQRRYKEAAQLQEKVVQASQSHYGKITPEALTAQNILAYIYFFWGRHQEATPLFQACLEGRTELLGSEHLSTLKTANGLAACLQTQQRHQESVTYFEWVYNARVKQLGPDHVRTLEAMSNLAFNLSQAGEYSRAEKLFTDARTKYVKHWGANSTTLLSFEGRYATHLAYAKRREEALAHFRQILEDGKNLKQRFWLKERLRYAKVLAQDPQNEEAGPLMEDILQKQRATLRENDPSILVTLNRLTHFYKDRGRMDQALAFAEQYLQGMAATYGKDHGKTEKAERLLQEIRDR